MQTVEGFKGYTLTENYLFAKDEPICVRLEDIVWIYSRKQTMYFFIVVGYSLVLYTKDQEYTINRVKKDDVDRVAEIVSNKNPNLMVGYSNENITRYKTGEY